MPGTDVLDLDRESTRVRVLLGDVVRARGLLVLLARQDFSARYRSASLGLAWSVLLPLLQGAVLALVFSRIVRLGSGTEYAVGVITAQTTWAYFSQTVQTGATAVVDGGGIAGKVYFPRLLLPAVPVFANGIGFTISFTVSLAFGAVIGTGLHLTLLAAPAVLLLAGALALGFAAPAAMLHVYSRDVRYTVSALVTIAFYATPVIYPLAFVQDLRWLILANPVTGIVQLARWVVLGDVDGGLGIPLAITGGWIAVLAVLTVVVYARYERIACDRL